MMQVDSVDPFAAREWLDPPDPRGAWRDEARAEHAPALERYRLVRSA
ncbi:hypothetical protein K2Z84_32185 [Candidatus Binatia bacterium]|jgi:hypothetical protein|nr:hypothetical protein [Candidatus Binatia bacterium]